MGQFTILDHTADAAIAVEAPTLADFFRAAAEGLFAIMLAGAPEGEKCVKTVSLRGRSREDLLVDWLNELIYWSETELFSFQSVEFRQLTDEGVEATVKGVFLPEPPVDGMEIKAATSHNLKIQRSRGFFRAVITFDL